MNTKPSVSLAEVLASIDTPTISNAIELLQIRPRTQGFAPVHIRCLFPELGRMCGYAVTAQVETLTDSSKKHEDTFIELFEGVERSSKPAVIVFQELGPNPEYATHCGEVMATIFGRLGGIGLVTDGAVRDVAQVKALRFHCFARGMVASHANFHIVRVGVPVQVLGLVVEPGDLLHGDENGLVQIPREAFHDLPKAIRAVTSKEQSVMDFARSQGFSPRKLRGRFLK